jgi:enoyl-CoA hydratase/carnithine racemase
MTYPMLCDIRLASETAKMGFVFTRRGMMPELAAHLLVQRVAGFSNAADLLMSGRIFTGAEAAEMGLVSRALPADELLPAAIQMARDYVNTAPASVAITKRLLWKGLESNPAAMMKLEGPAFAWLGNQPDAKEGIRSFLEKRSPDWTLTPGDVPDGIV